MRSVETTIRPDAIGVGDYSTGEVALVLSEGDDRTVIPMTPETARRIGLKLAELAVDAVIDDEHGPREVLQ